MCKSRAKHEDGTSEECTEAGTTWKAAGDSFLPQTFTAHQPCSLGSPCLAVALPANLVQLWKSALLKRAALFSQFLEQSFGPCFTNSPENLPKVKQVLPKNLASFTSMPHFNKTNRFLQKFHGL